MGGLLLLASEGHSWASDLVRAAWPLFILAVGFCAVIVVTDREDVVGRASVIIGVAILFLARFGVMPEATLHTVGPWAFILAGLTIALSGVWLRVQPVRQDEDWLPANAPSGQTPTSQEQRCCQHGSARSSGTSYAHLPRVSSDRR